MVTVRKDKPKEIELINQDQMDKDENDQPIDKTKGNVKSTPTSTTSTPTPTYEM